MSENLKISESLEFRTSGSVKGLRYSGPGQCAGLTVRVAPNCPHRRAPHPHVPRPVLTGTDRRMPGRQRQHGSDASASTDGGSSCLVNWTRRAMLKMAGSMFDGVSYVRAFAPAFCSARPILRDPAAVEADNRCVPPEGGGQPQVSGTACGPRPQPLRSTCTDPKKIPGRHPTLFETASLPPAAPHPRLPAWGTELRKIRRAVRKGWGATLRPRLC